MHFVRSLWRGASSPNANSSVAAASSPAGEAPGSSAATARRATQAKSSSSPSAPSSSSTSSSSTKKVVARSSSSDPDPDLARRARALRTPHSGYHFDGSGRRFFEGWYFKVTLPGEAQAFALIYSIEDPKPKKKDNGGGDGACAPPLPSSSSSSSSDSKPGVGVQIMGPDDSYLIQYDADVSKFWAKDPELALGACFEAKKKKGEGEAAAAGGSGALLSPPPSGPVPAAEFDRGVALGFQATATWHQGTVEAREEGASGSLRSTVGRARWAFRVEPVLGWGNSTKEDEDEEEDPLDHLDEDDHRVTEREGGDDDDRIPKQKATAGWLAALPVFEPHWQVLMAKGKATGWIEWGGDEDGKGAKRYEFEGAPAYAEKNWGGSFPSKWWWVQCDALEVVRKGSGGGVVGGEEGKEERGDAACDEDTAAVTAVGAVRSLPGASLLPWLAREDVGMIGLHYGGRFFEFVPWRGRVSWEVAPWGRWRCRAETATHEVELEATCEGRGTPLRAPTESRGLAVLCRDSFAGELTIKLYEKAGKGNGKGKGGNDGRKLVVELGSRRAAVETGGGPWGETWAAAAAMKQPFRSLVKAPVDPERLAELLPERWRPRGL